jgi:hypothetical protein
MDPAQCRSMQDAHAHWQSHGERGRIKFASEGTFMDSDQDNPTRHTPAGPLWGSLNLSLQHCSQAPSLALNLHRSLAGKPTSLTGRLAQLGECDW